MKTLALVLAIAACGARQTYPTQTSVVSEGPSNGNDAAQSTGPAPATPSPPATQGAPRTTQPASPSSPAKAATPPSP